MKKLTISKRQGVLLATAVTLVASSLYIIQSSTTSNIGQQAQKGQTYTIYNDHFLNDWKDGSGQDSTVNIATTNPTYTGSNSISFSAKGPFAGLYLFTTSPVLTMPYTALQFVLQASQSNQHYTVALYDQNEKPLKSPLSLARYGGDPVAGKWTVYTIPLADLGAQKTTVKALLLQSQANNPQPAVYVSAIQLVSTALASIPQKTPTQTPPPASIVPVQPSPSPTIQSGANWNSRVMAWIYPGDPACHAPDEYKDGRVIDTLKPQYFTLDTTGVPILLTTQTNGCNAYSPENAAEIKQYSKHQYITVAGGATGFNSLLADAKKITGAVTTLQAMVKQLGFTGIEIDFESFGQWTPKQYAAYKDFLTQLGNALHADGRKLMIDGPAFTDSSKSLYQWRYEDFNSLPVDYVVVMEYDWQFDLGAGTPVAPFAQISDVTKYVLSKISDRSKIVVGIPSYGYHGQTGTHTITLDTNQQSQQYNGYSSAKRDPASGEMMFTVGNTSYTYADSETLNAKRTLIESFGIQNVSVWHLGGNSWFTGKAEPAS